MEHKEFNDGDYYIHRVSVDELPTYVSNHADELKEKNLYTSLLMDSHNYKCYEVVVNHHVIDTCIITNQGKVVRKFTRFSISQQFISDTLHVSRNWVATNVVPNVESITLHVRGVRTWFDKLSFYKWLDETFKPFKRTRPLLVTDVNMEDVKRQVSGLVKRKRYSSLHPSSLAYGYDHVLFTKRDNHADKLTNYPLVPIDDDKYRLSDFLQSGKEVSVLSDVLGKGGKDRQLSELKRYVLTSGEYVEFKDVFHTTRPKTLYVCCKYSDDSKLVINLRKKLLLLLDDIENRLNAKDTKYNHYIDEITNVRKIIDKQDCLTIPYQ